ncbi:hypothetical protein AB0A63_18805 [Lentzea sp. NPDC042327]|uniref:hypothetical protein n=1 Tax=Lentzea sp. NPDC042327 TaxID=3154801 RepID=UPI00340D6423
MKDDCAVGVERGFLLVDPWSRRPVALAPQAARARGGAFDGGGAGGVERAAALVAGAAGALVAPALRERGALSTVERQIDWLRHNGCGAACRRSDPESPVDMLIARTREET